MCICATSVPTAARMRRTDTLARSIGSTCNDMRARISRTRRWNFWRSCPRQGRRGNSLRAPNWPALFGTVLVVGSHALFANETHVGPLAIRTKQHHIVFFQSATLHPGRTHRHAGNGKASRIRLFGKEALQRRGGYMPLDDIARHLRGVAGGEIVGNAEPSLHCI